MYFQYCAICEKEIRRTADPAEDLSAPTVCRACFEDPTNVGRLRAIAAPMLMRLMLGSRGTP